MTTHNQYVLVINYDVFGTYHNDGYCSDPGEIYTYNGSDTEEIVPTKEFVRDYCGSDGEITYNGLSSLSDTRYCSKGSGYCGCSKNYDAKKATLIKKSKVREQFLDECDSSPDEMDSSSTKAPPPSQLSHHSPPKYRTKFDNPEYRRRVGKINCNRGAECPRRNNKIRPCYYNHNF